MKKKMKMIMPDLPPDLINDIQLLLPVKSLVRFKCVSKSWLAHFQSPDFIKSHFLKQKALDGDNFDNSVVLLSRQILYSTPSFISFTTMEECNSTLTVKENIRISDLNESWCIRGECMGLICLSSYEKVALWNPATREFKYLPLVYRSKAFYSGVALGYDHKTNDFKVVRYGHKRRGGEILNVAEVYSLNQSKWRKLPIQRKGKRGYGCGLSIFINGVCHWVVYNDNGQPSIVSFDMTNETHKTTSLDIGDYVDFELFSDGECLAAVYISASYSTCFNIWKLKLNDLDNKASWTKQNLGTKYYCFGFWKNGQMLMRGASADLILHDPKTGEDRILDSCLKTETEKNNMETFGCLVYVRSLHQIK